MKKLLSIATLFSLVLLAASCGKVEKILVKKDGTWQVTYQRTVTTDSATNVSVTDIDEDSLGTVSFNDDGTGVMTSFDGSTDDFTWSVNDDNDEVFITTIDSATSVSTTMTYEVVESSSKEQMWHTHMTFSFPPFFTSYIEIDMTMERL